MASECAHCGTAFVSKEPQQKFCVRQCRAEARLKRAREANPPFSIVTAVAGPLTAAVTSSPPSSFFVPARSSSAGLSADAGPAATVERTLVSIFTHFWLLASGLRES